MVGPRSTADLTVAGPLWTAFGAPRHLRQLGTGRARHFGSNALKPFHFEFAATARVDPPLEG